MLTTSDLLSWFSEDVPLPTLLATDVNLTDKFIQKFPGSLLLFIYLVLFSVYVIGILCKMK